MPNSTENQVELIFDYFIKDYTSTRSTYTQWPPLSTNLGNVRLVITEENATLIDKWLATMETHDSNALWHPKQGVRTQCVYANIEENDFDNLPEFREDLPTGYPIDASVEFNERIARLAAENGTIIGPSKFLEVKAGERVFGGVSSFYKEDAPGTTYNNLGMFVEEMLIAIAASGVGVLPIQPDQLLNIASGGNSQLNNSLAQLLGASFDTASTTTPHAYLVWTAYDSRFKVVASNSGAIRVLDPNSLERLLTDVITITQDGYLHVYVSNGSSASVSFDNFLVSSIQGNVRQINHYYPYGLSIAGLSQLPTRYLHGYQGKELFTRDWNVSNPSGLEMYDFHARLYDPQLGRWFAPDPAEQFHNPYLAMGNNPVSFVDPDGESILAVIGITLLLTTDLGYDIQKYISPVAVHVDLNFGTHANGIGLDVSVGVPQAAPVSYRYDLGATYYFNRPGGYGPGWQVRNGAEWGVGLPGLQLQYGGMRYRDYSGGELLADQVVHTAQIGNPLLNVAYSNDTDDSFPWAKYVPLIPKLRDGSLAENDRYRTASGRIRVGLFETGFFLHTGEAETTVQTRDSNGNLTSDYFRGGNINDAKRSNGIAYFGFSGFRLGWDSEGVRNFLQNRVAHDGWSSQPLYGTRYPWFEEVDRRSRFVFQFGNF